MRSAVWADVDYPVTQPYNPAVHTGIDIGCPSGTIIYAARAGVVERVQTGMTSVRVFAERDFYLHGTSLVTAGQLVREGQPVIRSGAVQVDPRYPLTGPHFHFEIQNGFSLPGAPPSAPEAPLDPVPMLLAALTYGSNAGQLLGETVDPHLLAQLIYLAGLGRTYSGTEGDWLVQIIQSSPPDFTGATLGAVVNSTEGKAWTAKLAAVRGFSADQITTALKDVEPAAPKTGTIAGPITVTFE